MSINERLKQLRKTLGYTQGKFSERIAISVSYLSDMELGNNPVSERIIRLTTMEFGINEHWLRTGEGEMYNEGEDIAAITANRLFKSLSPAFKEHAIVQLNSLSELNKLYREH